MARKTVPDTNPLTSAPTQKEKVIAERLRAMWAKRDGGAAFVGQSRKKRPNESTESRNNRIIERYAELLQQRDGKTRGIIVRLGEEFELSHQYVSKTVIRPYQAQAKK